MVLCVLASHQVLLLGAHHLLASHLQGLLLREAEPHASPKRQGVVQDHTLEEQPD